MNLADLLQKRLRAQADLLAALTDHPTIVGSGREHALTELLREVAPRRLEVLAGAVAGIGNDGQPHVTPSQVDIMLVDTIDYPTLLRMGTTVVALPQAVRAIIEVKSDLKKGPKFFDSLRQLSCIQIAAGPDDRFFTALFCFKSPASSKTLRSWLADVTAERKRLKKVADDKKSKDKARSNARTTRDALAAMWLPDLIASHGGAVALKTGNRYDFFVVEEGAPAAIAFLDQVVRRMATHVAQTQPVGPETTVRLSRAFKLATDFLGTPLKQDPKCSSLVVES